jgi:hypothetical protein
MTNKLPPCFAFRYTGKHQFKGEIERRFIEIKGYKYKEFHPEVFYGKKENGGVDWYNDKKYFGSTVVEITEDDFLAMTEPELTKLPDNFYFQYVDEKDREVLKERFGGGYEFNEEFIGDYYGKNGMQVVNENDKKYFPTDSTEITQADFIRLTEPEKKVEHEQPDFPYKGDIKDFPKEVVEWMLDNQVKQGNKRDVSVFERHRARSKRNGGFDWDKTDEGDDFCIDVINGYKFGLLIQPIKKTITGQIIEISERGILIELTKEQIKKFKIFETVTIK